MKQAQHPEPANASAADMAGEMAAFRQRCAQRVAALTQQGPPTIAQRRAAFEREHGAVPMPEHCEVHTIAQGSVRGECYMPAGAQRGKAIVYHHGGGYVFGSVASHRHFVARLAVAAQVPAYSLEYRLAPEHPFPAALDDALAWYRFVLSQGFAPGDLVLAGESAGGNLAAALLLSLRQAGLAPPAGAYLLSPWLDMTLGGASITACAKLDPMLTPSDLLIGAKAFCGGHAAEDPLVSPLHADLAGLPPLLIQVGTDEVLLSDSLDFARRAALARVDVSLQVRAALVHAWPLFHPWLPRAGGTAIREAGDWIAARLGTR